MDRYELAYYRRGAALSYTIAIERGDLNYSELEPNYRSHYQEMTERLEGEGLTVSPYKPRLDEYFGAFRSGWLINYVARFDGKAIGHANIYLTHDMHNGDLIASEDAIYVVPEHRRGIGRKLAKFALEDMRRRGVKRVSIQALTDLRVAKVWARMGFKTVAECMIYEF